MALIDPPVPTTSEAESNSVGVIIAAVIAAVAGLIFLADGTRIGDGRTNHLSSYLTGGSTTDTDTSGYEAYQLGR